MTARDDIAELASSLRPSLLRLVRVIRQQRADISMTLSQLSAIGTLEKNGPMSAGELAACERVQPPSMTKVLGSLDEAGYITRAPHPTDGRQAIIALTPAGHAFVDSERRARDAWLYQRLDKLDPEERVAIRKVIPILDKLAEL